MNVTNITLKTPEQIAKIRSAGKIAAGLLEAAEQKIQPGITTLHLEILADKYIKNSGAEASFKGYKGFPSSICVSVNEEVVHGVPGLRVLNEGDIVSVDVGIYLDGFHADAARTFAVGKISLEKQSLIDVTRQSFYEALKYALSGNYVHDISAAIEDYVLKHNYYVVKEYGGHGIGEVFHEPPPIPNCREAKNEPVRLEKGMTLAIEPVVTMSADDIVRAYNNVTILTKDGICSSHYENTIVITENEPEILTV